MNAISTQLNEDVETKWPIILSYKPDFIKFHLVHSDEHRTRRDDPKYFGRRGLNPELARIFVELARAHGLRIAAHALTGFDFGVAVQAGVDEITHMPGYESPQRINAEDAALAGSKGVTVITTLNAAEASKDDPPVYEAIRETQIANLRLLKENGVRIAVGSDAFHGDSRIEAEYLRQLGVFFSDPFAIFAVQHRIHPHSRSGQRLWGAGRYRFSRLASVPQVRSGSLQQTGRDEYLLLARRSPDQMSRRLF